MGESKPSLAELVDEYARAYFADHVNVFDTRPDDFRREDLVGLSEMARTVVEMVLIDWTERIDELFVPMRMIARRLQEGPSLSPELVEAIEGLRQLSPEALRERVH